MTAREVDPPAPHVAERGSGSAPPRPGERGADSAPVRAPDGGAGAASSGTLAPAPGYAQTVTALPVVRLEEDAEADGEAVVAEEAPVALVYNGRSHAVMMCTPTDLEDFAVGFSLSEEIVASAADIARVEVVRYAAGIELQLAVPAGAADRLAERRRAISGRTGCGLCGVEAIGDAVRAPRVVGHALTVDHDALWRAGAALDGHQPLNRRTNAIHAAAFCSPDGTIVEAREDVGRHNALDKVIGALARRGRDPREGFVVVTSRASYELVQKCAVAGIELLAAVSRPTALAVRLAGSSGMTLVALLRGRSANVYAGRERIVGLAATGLHPPPGS